MTEQQVPPEGTIIWVWIGESFPPHRLGIGPVKCRVGRHWHGRDAQAHVLDGKEWVWLREDRIFAESQKECVRQALEAETEELNRLKDDYEQQLAWVAELREKWA